MHQGQGNETLGPLHAARHGWWLGLERHNDGDLLSNKHGFGGSILTPAARGANNQMALCLHSLNGVCTEYACHNMTLESGEQ
jgi:hypothetical protein